MKAIVLDYKGGKAALLLEDGTTAYRRMRCTPGEYVEVPDNDNITRMTSVMRTIAAMLVLVLGLGSYYTDIVMEYSYVSVDVNPSIEFALNRRDRVVEVEALNPDAKVIVSELDKNNISGKTLHEAMELTVGALIKKGYMKRDEAYMLLDVASKNDERGEKLSNLLKDYLEKDDERKPVPVTYAVVRSSLKDREEARKMKLSSGRYERMVEAYGPKDVSETAVREYKVKPVREMVESNSEQQISAKVDTKKSENIKDKEKKDKNKPDKKTDQKANSSKKSAAQTNSAAASAEESLNSEKSSVSASSSTSAESDSSDRGDSEDTSNSGHSKDSGGSEESDSAGKDKASVPEGSEDGTGEEQKSDAGASGDSGNSEDSSKDQTSTDDPDDDYDENAEDYDSSADEFDTGSEVYEEPAEEESSGDEGASSGDAGTDGESESGQDTEQVMEDGQGSSVPVQYD